MVYRATTLVKEDFANVPWIRRLRTSKSRCQARARALMACSAWPSVADQRRTWPPRGGRTSPIARLVRPRRATTCTNTPNARSFSPVLSFPPLPSFTFVQQPNQRSAAPPSPCRTLGLALRPRHSSATAVAPSCFHRLTAPALTC